MSNIVYPLGRVDNIVIGANESIAIASEGSAVVYLTPTSAAANPIPQIYATVQAGETVLGPFASGALLSVESQGTYVHFNVGTNPVVGSLHGVRKAGVNALNTTGTVSAKMIIDGLVTSTTAAAVTGTLVSGALLDAALELEVGDCLDWSVINLGTANTFTVAPGSTHTIVGSTATAHTSSSEYLTRKTAPNTFVTYRKS